MTTAAARLDLRLNPADKDRITRAADLRGVPLSAFVRDAAMREAESVMAAELTVTLSVEESRRFLKALDAPFQPNAKLKKALPVSVSASSASTNQLEMLKQKALERQNRLEKEGGLLTPDKEEALHHVSMQVEEKERKKERRLTQEATRIAIAFRCDKTKSRRKAKTN